MNEELPPPYDPATPPPPPPSLPPGAPKPPNFWSMFSLGIGLLILSWILCVACQNSVPLGIGFFVAVGSLFFTGYRGIFIGFVGPIGVVLLLAAIVCGAIIATSGGNMH